MLWRTHIVTGASAGLLLAGQTNVETAVASASIAGLAALLPDIDSPQSKLGRLVPVIPRVLSITVGHRGLLHSLVGALAMSLLMTVLIRIWYDQSFWVLLPLVLVGYVSHILIDSLTNSGCPLLYPLPFHLKVPLFSTGSFAERLIAFPAMLFLFMWLSGPLVWGYVKNLI